MFHTPPVKADWTTEVSIKHSYDVANNSSLSDIENDEDDDNNSQSATLDTNETKESPSIKTDSTDPNEIGDIKKSAIEVREDFSELDFHIESNRNNNPFLNNDSINNTNNNDTTTVTTGTMNTTIKNNNNDSISFFEATEIPSEGDLPIELLKVYENFLKQLKEPKFERSLASFEIAELFQRFYQDFQLSCKEYNNKIGKYELKNITQSNNNNKNNDDSEYENFRYNLIIERIICDKFYSQVVFPLKNIEIDEFEKDFSEEFSDKLGCLGSLHINFHNLDIDFPENIEKDFLNEIEETLLPEFELLTAERSPTLKMKYLIKIHESIAIIFNKIIEKYDSNNVNEKIILNTDIYLPILIYSIIKLKELRNYFLIRQLSFMKRFSNEYIFDNSIEALQIERGKILYVCANFEAAISYLSSVTLENLGLDIPSDDINLLPGSMRTREELIGLLTVPLKLESIEDKIVEFKKTNPLILNNEIVSINRGLMGFTFNNSLNNLTSNITNNFIPNPLVNADEGIKSISKTVDSSLKNILGRVPWMSDTNIDTIKENLAEPKLDDTAMQQLMENEAFSSFENNKEGIISKFTSGVMKSFQQPPEPTTNTNTNTNTSTNTTDNLTNTGTTPMKSSSGNIRSRAASFMNTSFFGSPSHDNGSTTNFGSGTSLLTTLEQAFINTPNGISPSRLSNTRKNTLTRLPSQGYQLKPITKPFEEMSISELREMYNSYQEATNFNH